MTTKFKPMLAGTLNCLEDLKFPVYASAKYDGIRCIVKDGKALSRTLKPIPNKYIQDILSQLKVYQPKGCPMPLGYDGELLLQGIKTFNETTSAIMREDGEPDFVYVIFDLISEGTFEERRKGLVSIEKHFKDLKYITINPSIILGHIKDTVALEDIYVKMGYEGIMFRYPESIYKYGRSTVNEGYLLKYKRFLQDEAQCIGMVEQMTNNNPKKKNLLGRSERSTNKENMVPAGVLGALKVRFNDVEFELGTGFNDDDRMHIWMHKEDYIGKTVTFKYQELSVDKVPRFPVWLGFRHKED